jgi:hypothetical protein
MGKGIVPHRLVHFYRFLRHMAHRFRWRSLQQARFDQKSLGQCSLRVDDGAVTLKETVSLIVLRNTVKKKNSE